MTPFLKITTRSSGLVPSLKTHEPAASVADSLVRGLHAAGVDTCFGIPGRHVQAIFRSLPGAGIRAILARHEQGAVYMAEQTEPVRRRVAVKVIRPGMDSDRVVARFEAERQALALMDHPNIARVLDAGATRLGLSGTRAVLDGLAG